MMVTTHAITIDAAPEDVWPWLVQMGWQRCQWYTARWVDRLRDLGHGRTRFVFRSRVCLGPWWLAVAYWALVIPADFVMARQMLHEVKSRAKGHVFDTIAAADERPARAKEGLG